MTKDGSLLKQMGSAALAGVAGCVAIQAVRKTNASLMPGVSDPVRRDPGKFFVNKVEDLLPRSMRKKIPEPVESLASGLLSLGYGSAGAAVYSSFRRDPNILLDGAALGSAIWAIGYLGWLPALDLAPRVNKHSPAQIASSLAQHIAYGVMTVAAYRRLRAKLD